LTLPTEHIKIYRRKEVIRPVFLGEDISLSKTLIATIGSHVGENRGAIAEALSDCEQLGYNYRLVRGLSSILERRCLFESQAVIPPIEARAMVFREAAGRVVTTEKERVAVLASVAKRLGVTVEQLDASLYGDLEDEQVLVEFSEPEPAELNRYYNYANTVALLSYSRSIYAETDERDEYLGQLAERIGETRIEGRGRGASIYIKLKPTRRLSQRGARIDEFAARLLEARSWSLKASIVYPTRRKDPAVMDLSNDQHGDLLKKDPYREELIIEIPSRMPKKPTHGEVIVVERLAHRLGVTEKQLLKEIREEGHEYRDLGGVLVTPSKLEEISGALGGVETLGEAKEVLRGEGVRSVIPVLEALGYQVEPGRPRDESRVYRL
jgi:predicted nuclease of restriction endonuclease-like RecB superfamily